MDAGIHAALIGGAVGGAGVVLGGAGVWWVARWERRATALDEERTAVEAAAWELTALLGQLLVTAPALNDAARATFGGGRRVDSHGRDLGTALTTGARAFGFIHARRGRYPDIDRGASGLMDLAAEVIEASTRRAAVSVTSYEQRYRELADAMNSAVLELASPARRRWRRRHRRDKVGPPKVGPGATSRG